MRVQLSEDGEYKPDQQATIDELLEKQNLVTANGIQGPIGNESNVFESRPQLLP